MRFATTEVPGSLHPSRGHPQWPVEGLRRRPALQDDDLAGGGVLTSVRAARVAARLRQGAPLWLAGESAAGRKAQAVSATAAAAGGRGAGCPVNDGGAGRPGGARRCAALSPLWWRPLCPSRSTAVGRPTAGPRRYVVAMGWNQLSSPQRNILLRTGPVHGGYQPHRSAFGAGARTTVGDGAAVPAGAASVANVQKRLRPASVRLH